MEGETMKFSETQPKPPEEKPFVDNTGYLTKEEKALLKEIVNDKFSVGAFSGMITNIFYDGKCGEQGAKSVIKKALEIRLLAKKLSEE
jgi:hypothetical protein